jgi:starvation-inducible DNA-binding protein
VWSVGSWPWRWNSGSSIPQLSPATSNANFVEETTDHLSAHAANPRADIDYAAGWGDEDTADLYTELSREVDQQRYFLESHLRTEPVGTVRGAQPGQVRGDSERPGWALQSQHGGSHGQAPSG